MSTFDLDAFREAHRPFAFTAGGFTFEARIISAEQMRQFATVASRADAAGQHRALAALLRIAFPWRPSYIWRGDPVTTILALEPQAREEALESFFAWVRETNKLPHPTIPGTRSPGPTLAKT